MALYDRIKDCVNDLRHADAEYLERIYMSHWNRKQSIRAILRRCEDITLRHFRADTPACIVADRAEEVGAIGLAKSIRETFETNEPIGKIRLGK